MGNTPRLDRRDVYKAGAGPMQSDKTRGHSCRHCSRVLAIVNKAADAVFSDTGLATRGVAGMAFVLFTTRLLVYRPTAVARRAMIGGSSAAR